MTSNSSLQSPPPKTISKSSPIQRLRMILPIALLLLVTGFGIRVWLSEPDDNTLELNGRIEGYESDLGAKIGGRVASVMVREGDRVEQGDVIAQLEDSELRAEYQAAQASTLAAQQLIIQAESQIGVIESQINETQLLLQQDQGNTAGRVNESEATVATAEAQLAAAQAQLQQAESELRLAELDRDRAQSLVNDGAISQQSFDQAQTRYETARDSLDARQAAVSAAQRQVSAAQGGLLQAQTTQFNPEIRAAQITRLERQLEQANAALAAARAEVERVNANANEIAARLANLEITSPIDGVVVARMVEPGEVIAAGTTVVTVINLEEVYLRGYIPERDVGHVRVGQPAQVFLDSAPEQPLAATVIAIDTEASFTPENIYFRDDRVMQVFGLRLGIENPDGFAKPGMPADGEIFLFEEE